MRTLLLPRDGSSIKIKELPVKVKPEVDIDVLTAIASGVLEDSYVYVHCYFDNPHEGSLIRIWKTTFLMDLVSGTRSKLVHAENISFAPVWTLIPDRTTFSFLLIFSALPKSCTQFDLIEEIPQPGGFHVKNIQRNQQDVYHITLA
jgi:hypothetical protein